VLLFKNEKDEINHKYTSKLNDERETRQQLIEKYELNEKIYFENKHYEKVNPSDPYKF
jgi:hypothetical protein